MLEPYQPGKIPVLLVHGLLSSPVTWAPMFNDLQADPDLREPLPVLGLLLPDRRAVPGDGRRPAPAAGAVARRTRPEAPDPALDRMVLVGHSMGGLVSKLMTVDGGDDFWKLVSDAPFADVKATTETRDWLRRHVLLRAAAGGARVVFLGTPHHGSKLSPSLVARDGGEARAAPEDASWTRPTTWRTRTPA